MTVHEVARQLATSDDVVRQMLRDGRIAGFKAGGQWRIPRISLSEYLKKQLSKE